MQSIKVRYTDGRVEEFWEQAIGNRPQLLHAERTQEYLILVIRPEPYQTYTSPTKVVIPWHQIAEVTET